MQLIRGPFRGGKLTLESGRLLVLLYCVYALLAALAVVWKLPPLMGADEPNHFKRADLVARGKIIGKRFQTREGPASGGEVEVNIDAAEANVAPMAFHPEVKTQNVDLAKAVSIPWGDQVRDQPFENTAVYPPFFYLPSALAINLGKGLNLSIFQTLLLSRLANALICLIVGAFALATAKKERIWLFTLLLLPMSLALSATVTQDGLLIATACLGSAFMVKGFEEKQPLSNRELWFAAVCLGLVGMAKPPYILLSLLLLLVPSAGKGRLAALAAGLAGLLWQVLMAFFVEVPMRRPGLRLDPGAQIQFLLHHPLAVVAVASGALRHSGGEYLAQSIGVLGNLDTLLPKSFYLLAVGAMILAGLLCWTLRGKEERRRSLWTLLILGATIVGIFAALYIAYTPVGARQVDGVQGRYFLPVAAFLPLALVGSGVDPGKPEFRKFAALALSLFPLLGILTMELALSHRYF